MFSTFSASLYISLPFLFYYFSVYLNFSPINYFFESWMPGKGKHVPNSKIISTISPVSLFHIVLMISVKYWKKLILTKLIHNSHERTDDSLLIQILSPCYCPCFSSPVFTHGECNDTLEKVMRLNTKFGYNRVFYCI